MGRVFTACLFGARHAVTIERVQLITRTTKKTYTVNCNAKILKPTKHYFKKTYKQFITDGGHCLLEGVEYTSGYRWEVLELHRLQKITLLPGSGMAELWKWTIRKPIEKCGRAKYVLKYKTTTRVLNYLTSELQSYWSARLLKYRPAQLLDYTTTRLLKCKPTELLIMSNDIGEEQNAKTIARRQENTKEDFWKYESFT